MFDLSLSKLALIGAVALVVVGPEKLPKVARMAGTLIGRAQRYLSEVKSEVSRNMVLDDLHSLKEEIRSTARDIEGEFSPAPPAAAPIPDATEAAAFKRKARTFRRNKNRLRQHARSAWP
jgi:Tat protein translocase TatB subunit